MESRFNQNSSPNPIMFAKETPNFIAEQAKTKVSSIDNNRENDSLGPKTSSNIHKTYSNQSNIQTTGKKITNSDIFILRYYFNTENSTFTPKPELSQIGLNSEQRQKIEEVVPHILEKSGIKKSKCILTTLIFFLITLVGFCLGFFLIMVGSPLVSFFIVIGYTIVRGTQIERFEAWWKLGVTAKEDIKDNKIENRIRGGGDVKRCLEDEGLTIYYSFSEGKLFFTIPKNSIEFFLIEISKIQFSKNP